MEFAIRWFPNIIAVELQTNVKAMQKSNSRLRDLRVRSAIPFARYWYCYALLLHENIAYEAIAECSLFILAIVLPPHRW